MAIVYWNDLLEEFDVPASVAGLKKKTEGELLPPRVVLFDIYGTLVKPLVGDLEAQLKSRLSVESFEKTARRFGLEKGAGRKLFDGFYRKVREIHERMKNIGVRQPEILIEYVWMELLAGMGVDVSLEEARSFAIYRELHANPVAPFQGVSECLTRLKENKIELGIVSNSQFYTMPILKKVLQIDLDQILNPNFVFLSYEIGFAKPDPHFFLLAKTKLALNEIAPEEAVVIGNDWVNDVMSSRNFGFQGLFFRGEGREQEYDPGAIGKGVAVAYNYKDVETLLGIRG